MQPPCCGGAPTDERLSVSSFALAHRTVLVARHAAPGVVNPGPSCLKSSYPSQLPTRPKANKIHVKFRKQIKNEIEFDPTIRPRLDVDLISWSIKYDRNDLKHSQTTSRAWSPRDDPNFRDDWIRRHLSRGFPSDPGYVRTCEAIALRNARELSEHLGTSKVSDAPWPRDDSYEYGPYKEYRDKEASVHVDMLPSLDNPDPDRKGLSPLKAGVHAPIGHMNGTEEIDPWEGLEDPDYDDFRTALPDPPPQESLLGDPYLNVAPAADATPGREHQLGDLPPAGSDAHNARVQAHCPTGTPGMVIPPDPIGHPGDLSTLPAILDGSGVLVSPISPVLVDSVNSSSGGVSSGR